jgi:hypothetical protein
MHVYAVHARPLTSKMSCIGVDLLLGATIIRGRTSAAHSKIIVRVVAADSNTAHKVIIAATVKAMSTLCVTRTRQTGQFDFRVSTRGVDASHGNRADEYDE